jgi:dCTP deaminase
MSESIAPWRDYRWLPGVLNKKQIIKLIEAHLILGITKDEAEEGKMAIDEEASALDLHLMDECYLMKRGSIKPFNKSYGDIILDLDYAERQQKGSGDKYHLKKGNCYIFRIKEKLRLCSTTPIYGQATAKSSVGRVDVIARLIVDGMSEYEKFNPNEVDSGDMFLEITAITFDIMVKENMTMSQLRFFYGKIEHSVINDEDFIRSILNLRDSDINHGTLSVDISNTNVGREEETLAAAYKTKEANQITDPIDLEKKNCDEDKYQQNKFWELEKSQERYNIKSIGIAKDRFYILRSKERISLPAGVCIYCRAMDETLGEMRIHYAGFVHPLFGNKREDGKKGTPLIFEVRGHNVEVLLTHGEILARLFFYRMSESVDEEKYNKLHKKDYNDQELNLSNLFQEFWS